MILHPLIRIVALILIFDLIGIAKLLDDFTGIFPVFVNRPDDDIVAFSFGGLVMFRNLKEIT